MSLSLCSNCKNRKVFIGNDNGLGKESYICSKSSPWVEVTDIEIDECPMQDKVKKEIEIKTNSEEIKNKLIKYMISNRIGYIKVGLGKQTDYYEYYTDFELDEIADIISKILKEV